MTFPKARLVVSACLLVAWLGFLCYLVIERPTVILSKPQFMSAQAVIVAEVSDAQGQANPSVLVKQVEWPPQPADLRAGDRVVLPNLPNCSAAHGYRGAGDYLIPLIQRGGVFQIAPVSTRDDVRIYPWTPETLARLETILKSKK